MKWWNKYNSVKRIQESFLFEFFNGKVICEVSSSSDNYLWPQVGWFIGLKHKSPSELKKDFVFSFGYPTSLRCVTTSNLVNKVLVFYEFFHVKFLYSP